MKQYFLDTASTTRPYQEVVDTVADVMYNHYGNPSSTHEMGQDARNIIESVRNQIAEDINCDPSEVIFTSGACEANSLALTATKKVLTTRLEHKSIEMLCKDVACFNNDEYGNVVLDNNTLCRLGEHNWLVSVHAANSEIGAIQDIASISKFVHKYINIFHVDATQLYPERRIDVKELGIDLMSVSAQKFHGPRGIGFLYCKDGIKLKPLISGSQENGRRGGTYNTPSIAGMGKALEINRGVLHNYTNVCTKFNRDELANKILEIPNVYLNGPSLDANRLYNNISIRIDGVKANDLVTLASMYGIYISAGSACSSGESIPSSTLKAIGLTDEQALSTIRITVDETLNQHDISNIAKILKNLIERLRNS